MRQAGARAARAYDWSVVTGQVLAVYETVLATAAAPVREDPRTRTAMGLLRAATGSGEA